jgi:hypothetical protein
MKSEIKENEMKTKIKDKFIIIIIAALLTFIGFNLLVSHTAVDLIELDNPYYEITYESSPVYIT